MGALKIKGVGTDCEVPDKLADLNRMGFRVYTEKKP
jgi:hypothetical protein